LLKTVSLRKKGAARFPTPVEWQPRQGYRNNVGINMTGACCHRESQDAPG